MRHVETGVDVGEHRVAAVEYAVAENAEEFFAATLARDAVEVLQREVRGEAGAEDGGDVFVRPVEDALHVRPVGFLREVGVYGVGAGEDDGV